MNIKILGTGCAKCKKLEANTKEAIGELGIEARIEKVENIEDIMAYGIMSTPALVIDEQIKSVGRILSVEEIKKHLK